LSSRPAFSVSVRTNGVNRSEPQLSMSSEQTTDEERFNA
jgi:hypothetical protein